MVLCYGSFDFLYWFIEEIQYIRYLVQQLGFRYQVSSSYNEEGQYKIPLFFLLRCWEAFWGLL